MKKSEVIQLIAERARQVGSQNKLAKEWGVRQSYLSDVLAGKREPNDALLAHLGLKWAIVRIKKEQVEDGVRPITYEQGGAYPDGPWREPLED